MWFPQRVQIKKRFLNKRDTDDTRLALYQCAAMADDRFGPDAVQLGARPTLVGAPCVRMGQAGQDAEARRELELVAGLSNECGQWHALLCAVLLGDIARAGRQSKPRVQGEQKQARRDVAWGCGACWCAATSTT